MIGKFRVSILTRYFLHLTLNPHDLNSNSRATPDTSVTSQMFPLLLSARYLKAFKDEHIH